MSDLERLEKDLLSQTDMLDKSLAQLKKDSVVGNEELIEKINQIHDQKSKDTPAVNEIAMEITRTKSYVRTLDLVYYSVHYVMMM